MITVFKDPYKSIIVKDESGNFVTISEGDKIKFSTESGEVKKGTVVIFNGKKDKLKIQILPVGSECEEIWSVLQIAEDSLVLDEDKEE